MAKAILVMDMPEDCSECEYLRKVQNVRCCVLCDIAPRIRNSRPSWCPLKPIPKRRTISPNKGFLQGSDFGWNACIDAICGKE